MVPYRGNESVINEKGMLRPFRYQFLIEVMKVFPRREYRDILVILYQFLIEVMKAMYSGGILSSIRVSIPYRGNESLLGLEKAVKQLRINSL